MLATITLPRILRLGAGASAELAVTLDQLGLVKPLFVTDAFIRACDFFEPIVA